MDGLMPNLDSTEQLTSEIVSKYPEAILMLRPCFVSENDWDMAISLKPALFAKCPNKTLEICTTALTVDGLNLEYIDPRQYDAKNYAEMCRIAVEQNPLAISLVPKSLRTKELMGIAYSKDPNLMMGKQLSPELILQILKNRPSLIKDVKDPTDEMIITALEHDPRVIVYFRTISNVVRDYFEERYPQYAAMLIHD